MMEFATNTDVHDKFIEVAISRPAVPITQPHGNHL